MNGDTIRAPNTSPLVPNIQVNPPFLTRFAKTLMILPNRVLLSQLNDSLSWYADETMECKVADDDRPIITAMNIDAPKRIIVANTSLFSFLDIQEMSGRRTNKTAFEPIPIL
mmetsp:Transcript_24530/g.36627  ORF Transcript_24530/g.36627 Transcript_24530/m.36627 type:complete len:112 (+) Transcript_24530:331-666(+)